MTSEEKLQSLVVPTVAEPGKKGSALPLPDASEKPAGEQPLPDGPEKPTAVQPLFGAQEKPAIVQHPSNAWARPVNAQPLSAAPAQPANGTPLMPAKAPMKPAEDTGNPADGQQKAPGASEEPAAAVVLGKLMETCEKPIESPENPSTATEDQVEEPMARSRTTAAPEKCAGELKKPIMALHAQPPPGGVRFGTVEIVPPADPVTTAEGSDKGEDEDDEDDEDFDIDLEDDEDMGEDEDIGVDEVKADGNKLNAFATGAPLPELPKGLLSKLLSNGSLGSKPLHAAASDGNVGEVRRLLADDGEMAGLVNDVDVFSYTPLHIAAENGQLDVCKVLLELRADVNASTKLHSSTALHYAAMAGHDAILKFLVEAGAEVNALTDDKRTPLFQAALKGHFACVETLLKHGADPSLRNEEDKSPADVSLSKEVTNCLSDWPEAKRRKVCSQDVQS